MRATRSDSMILDDCWVSDNALLIRADDILPFRRQGANWFWASYTAVYLGIAVAAYAAIIETVRGRTPPGFAQSLAYHPDVRRHVAEMSVDLEAARLLTYHSAWLSDTQGPLRHLGGLVPGQVFRRRSGDPYHPHGHDPWRRPCIVEDLTARTAVSRRRRRPRAISPPATFA